MLPQVACAWAWQLQGRVQLAEEKIVDYDMRIGDLEARLSDTDEGMNQNAELQAAKIRELDTEVRKLWDNVWKEASERLAKLEKSSAARARSWSPPPQAWPLPRGRSRPPAAISPN